MSNPDSFINPSQTFNFIFTTVFFLLNLLPLIQGEKNNVWSHCNPCFLGVGIASILLHCRLLLKQLLKWSHHWCCLPRGRYPQLLQGEGWRAPISASSRHVGQDWFQINSLDNCTRVEGSQLITTFKHGQAPLVLSTAAKLFSSPLPDPNACLLCVRSQQMLHWFVSQISPLRFLLPSLCASSTPLSFFPLPLQQHSVKPDCSGKNLKSQNFCLGVSIPAAFRCMSQMICDHPALHICLHERWGAAQPASFSSFVESLCVLCFWLCVCVPPRPLPFLSSDEAQTRVELQPLTSGLKSPADCLSLSLILTTAPRERK